MTFKFTIEVSYFLLALTLLSPFYVMIQFLSPENYSVLFLAPLWQTWGSELGFVFNPSPFALVYVFWYWPGLYITKLAYDTTKTQNRDRYDYAQKIVLLLIVQVVFTLLLPPASGSPPPINMPLPIVGIIALLLTRVTVRELETPWDGQDDSIEGEAGPSESAT